MSLIDTHCHLHDREFYSVEEAEKLLKNSHQQGISDLIVIGTNHADSLAARDFAAQHEHVYWSYGSHPSVANVGQFYGKVKNISEEDSELRRELARDTRDGGLARRASEEVFFAFRSNLVAIGEIGLDYHYEPYDRTAQIKLFEQQLQLAQDQQLPVIFHIRKAFDDFFPVVANFPRLTGVVHSFSDNKKNLRKILETTDFYVGVNGLATYSTLPTPPLERILLETDAPFLAPLPHRGETNQPAYVRYVAEFLAHKFACDLEQVSQQTTANARALFNFT